MRCFLENYFNSSSKNRIALVGANSQGKTYQLEQLSKTNKGKIIYVESETKSDENMKNSAESTTLIEWITELIGLDDLNKVIDNTITKLNIKNGNDMINVELKNCAKSYKGLIEFAMTTNSNDKKLSGSGEKVLGQLIMISNILNEDNNKYEYLIVDEPEAHLHPSLYYLIAKTLNIISHNGIKVVIATHSSEILQYFVEDSSEIVVMKKLEPIPLKKTESYYELKNQFRIYTDNNYMMKSFKRIREKDRLYFNTVILKEIYRSLFSNVVIIGEGVIEDELFKIYKNEYYKDYSECNVESIVVYGKDMIPWYISILKDIGIKTVCLFDTDNEDDCKHLEINNIIRELANKYYGFVGNNKNNIESYLNIKENGKGKDDIVELQYLYINNDKKLKEFLANINEMIKASLN